MNPDRKGRIVKAMSDAAQSKPERIWDLSLPEGVAAYSMASVLLLMPALKPGAPASIRRAYRDRIRCNATGICPRCRAVADSDNLRDYDHEPGCPVSDPALARWLDPAGLAAIRGGLLS